MPFSERACVGGVEALGGLGKSSFSFVCNCVGLIH